MEVRSTRTRPWPSWPSTTAPASFSFVTTTDSSPSKVEEAGESPRWIASTCSRAAAMSGLELAMGGPQPLSNSYECPQASTHPDTLPLRHCGTSGRTERPDRRDSVAVRLRMTDFRCADLSVVRHVERRPCEVLPRMRQSTLDIGSRPSAPRYCSFLRSRRLDRARGAIGPRAPAKSARSLLRGDANGDREARRNGGEVHGRRGRGRLWRADRPRG